VETILQEALIDRQELRCHPESSAEGASGNPGQALPIRPRTESRWKSHSYRVRFAQT